ncbi:hypothetical protein SSX86_000136 [Deinandra increscens subsp. villosa]|uniref:BHLH domain-containing protein n=1 Tax=Deinandra increscens subsp. villosa TaxID=3103831 RepID=A0AAP0E0B3_9ASTR
MEFSQPRPCGAPGAKPTQDFLSLYSPSQQDQTPSIPGDYPKTQNFLQPLEQEGKNVYKEGKYIEKSTPPSIVEHILPGTGMGTYSVSYMNKVQSQKVAKAEGIVISAVQSSSSNTNDENSNCASYRGAGFALWGDSNLNNGKTGKENIARTTHTMRDGVMKNAVTWMASVEQASQSSSIHNNPNTSFSALSTSHPSSSNKNLYFADTVKSSKSVQDEDYIDEDFIIKREPSFHHRGTISTKVDIANPDQKSNSPRSKHSATEQRRRSKINDRFSKLRGIMPHGDQKRDKASFLLEVIEYIQFLQEKVQGYEDPSHGWTSEPPKTIPSNNRPSDIFVNEPSLPMRRNMPDSNMIDSIDATKEISLHTKPTNEPSSFPDTATAGPHSQPQLAHSRSCKTDCTITNDMLKDQELVIESGTISISSIYSQGLSSAITEALKSSGLDLSRATISVQIDLGKRSKTCTLDSDLKEKETPLADDQSGRLANNSWEEESGKGFKRLKTNNRN